MGDDLQETGNTLKISLMMLISRKNLVLLPLVTIQARPVFLSIFKIFCIFDPFQNAHECRSIRPILRTFSKAPKKKFTPLNFVRKKIYTSNPLGKIHTPMAIHTP